MGHLEVSLDAEKLTFSGKAPAGSLRSVKWNPGAFKSRCLSK